MAARGELTVEVVLAALKRAGTTKHREGHARFGITTPKAFGVPMGEIQKLAKGHGKSHELASKLRASGWYEGRMMAIYVEEAATVTAAQMIGGLLRSTTGRCATRRASWCLIGRRMRLRRSRSGARARRSS